MQSLGLLRAVLYFWRVAKLLPRPAERSALKKNLFTFPHLRAFVSVRNGPEVLKVFWVR